MPDSMIIVEEIIFKSPAIEVWDLITNPEKTKQYMFGSEIVSDWQLGSLVEWIGQDEQGKPVVFVVGKVNEIVPLKKIVTSTFDPNSGMEDIPANHIPFSYELEDLPEGVLLRIKQGPFDGAEDAQKRYEESAAGWKQMVIPAMKKLLP